MKKCIFIVDDRVEDSSAVLLSLESMVNYAHEMKFSNAPAPEDTRIFFFHILWDDKPDCNHFFGNLVRSIKNRIAGHKANVIEIQYVPVHLNSERYEQNPQQVYETVKQKMVQVTKEWSGEENPLQAMLLDIILQEKIDIPRIDDPQKKEDLLSQLLYNQFESHCVPYTRYSEARIGNKWSALFPDSPEAFQHQAISTSAVNILFEKAVYSALEIGDQGG